VVPGDDERANDSTAAPCMTTTACTYVCGKSAWPAAKGIDGSRGRCRCVLFTVCVWLLIWAVCEGDGGEGKISAVAVAVVG
jgi:hypothetical protein